MKKSILLWLLVGIVGGLGCSGAAPSPALYKPVFGDQFGASPIADAGGSNVWFVGPATNLNLVGNHTIYRFNGSNTNQVIAAPYDTALSASGNFGPTTSQTSAEWLGVGQIYRIRQSGNLVKTRLYLAATTGITHLYLKIWRKVDGAYDLVGISEDLVSGLSGAAFNTKTLVTPLAVVEGDYIGMRAVYSSAAVQNFTARTGVAKATNYMVLNTAPAATAYAWEAQTATAGTMVPIEVYLAAPMFVTIGDSLISGSYSNHSFADNVLASISDPPVALAWNIGHALNYTYQNMGIGGDGIDSIDFRFTNDVINLHPQFVVLDGGVNNILDVTLTNSQILAHWTNIISACGTYGIKPVVLGMLPFRNYGLATTNLLQQRDAINAAVKSLVESSNGIYVNVDSYIGKNDPGGDAGNLWAVQAIYDSGDGIHLNPAGYAVVASAVIDALAGMRLEGGLSVSSLRARGNILLDGNAPKQIAMQRNDRPDNDGFELRLQAGGPTAGATNRNGGALTLSTGASAGNGRSRVAFLVPDIGASGAADNLPVEEFSLYRNAAGTAYAQLTSSGNNAGYLVYDGGAYKGSIGYDFALGQLALYSSLDASSPAIGITPSKLVSIGDGNVPTAKLHVFSSTHSTTNHNSAVFKMGNDPIHYMWGGVNTNTPGWGLFGTVEDGVVNLSTDLNPFGGKLGIGIGTEPLAFIHAKTNGPMTLRLESGSADSSIYFYDAGFFKGGFTYRNSDGAVGILSQNEGAAPQVFVDTSDRFHVGQNDIGIAKFNVLGSVGTSPSDNPLAKFYATSSRGIWMAYSNGVGYLGVIHEGFVNERLSLNPYSTAISLAGVDYIFPATNLLAGQLLALDGSGGMYGTNEPGRISGLTTGTIPKAGSATTLVDSAIVETSVVTVSKPVVSTGSLSGNGGVAVLAGMTSSGTALVSNTTIQVTLIPASKVGGTAAPTSFSAGKQARINLYGYHKTTGSPSTTFYILQGGTTLASMVDFAFTTGGVDESWSASIIISWPAVGATGSAWTQGGFISNGIGASGHSLLVTAPVTVDTSGDLDVQVAFGTANPANYIVTSNASIEWLN